MECGGVGLVLRGMNPSVGVRANIFQGIKNVTVHGTNTDILFIYFYLNFISATTLCMSSLTQFPVTHILSQGKNSHI